MQPERLNSIQYLRAIAALLVLYAHAIDLQSFLGGSFQQHFFYLENFGAIGVDIFFIISGFIIAHIAEDKKGAKAAIDFIKRRVIRIVPSYYIISLVLLVLVIAAGTIPVTKENIIKTFTILPLFDGGAEFWSPVLFLGWTLAFEFYFYLLYFIIILLKIMRKEIFIIVILILLAIARHVFSFNNIQWKFITNPIILEFCCGVLIALLYRAPLKIPPAVSKTFVAAGIILMMLLIWKGSGNFSEMADTVDGSSSLLRFIYWGLPSAILVFGILFLEKESSTPSFTNKWMLLLGDASYSIYLVHLIVYRSLYFVLKRIADKIELIPGDILIPVYMYIAIMASLIFYRSVEKQILKLNRSR
jgi:peptidoglycan/LPS O-acetylase OafA/YrhL